ncbi:hypothetical protein PROFUN_05892 [Planoprotostelium fungivorum]|uniref:Uncharacterized protein n=1 Tax=Planoprotostelium fungivorum TaxID=1890364 RepID=A0A2P6NKS4_9EUKA|nr:hypothetical protein PROFUN_05892 [Planoprotostelium fungivorum]
MLLPKPRYGHKASPCLRDTRHEFSAVLSDEISKDNKIVAPRQFFSILRSSDTGTTYTQLLSTSGPLAVASVDIQRL